MIKIDFIEPTSKTWNEWKKKCKAETLKLIESVKNGDTPSITDLHKEVKPFMISHNSAFKGKCAYCETLIISNQPGDVEHYRPKGKITDSRSKVIKINDSKGKTIDHPGYYWLAYCFKNLLPSCEDCNRPSKGNSDGALVGKWNQFPVVDFRALKPKDESKEKPLLINPCDVDPAIHIEIDETGVLRHNTVEGQTTIDIFGLNKREGLVRQRRKTYDDIINKMSILTLLIMKGKDSVKEKKELLDIKNGAEPYTIAARKAIIDGQASLDEIKAI